MKIGIIIVFYNNEIDLHRNVFNDLLTIKNHIHLCLVNNGSKDGTLNILEEQMEISGMEGTIIDIKQNKGNSTAIRAGARYLLNQNKVNHIGYIQIDMLNNIEELNTLFDAIIIYKDQIVQYSLKTIKSSQMKRIIFKNVFCILEYFSKLNIQVHKIALI
jgi:glycosyltransferase involved in cell wall biosynthesis